MVIALLVVVSLVGLWLFWRPARLLYIASSLGGLVFVALDTSDRVGGVEASIASPNMLVSGIVIGLMYFSDARRQFEARPLSS